MGEFLWASGPSLFDGAFLGVAGGAHWVGVVRKSAAGSPMPLDIGIRLGTRIVLTDLWKAPDGTLWVVGEDGNVRVSGDPWGKDADHWEMRALDAPLFGITGVDPTCVLAHGIRQSDGAHVLRLFNGARWNPVGGPEIRIEAVDLTAPDRIWIAGDGVARFDGVGWDVLETPPVLDLHAPSDDAVVVVLEDGTFGRITPDGLLPLGRVEGGCAVAIWEGRIWIGAGDNGLWRAGGGDLVCVREDRHCVSLEVHGGSLMIGCNDLISSTTDGERFPGGCRGYLEGLKL